jgi:hypothetical protein
LKHDADDEANDHALRDVFGEKGCNVHEGSSAVDGITLVLLHFRLRRFVGFSVPLGCSYVLHL